MSDWTFLSRVPFVYNNNKKLSETSDWPHDIMTHATKQQRFGLSGAATISIFPFLLTSTVFHSNALLCLLCQFPFFPFDLSAGSVKAHLEECSRSVHWSSEILARQINAKSQSKPLHWPPTQAGLGSRKDHSYWHSYWQPAENHCSVTTPCIRKVYFTARTNHGLIRCCNPIHSEAVIFVESAVSPPTPCVFCLSD